VRGFCQFSSHLTKCHDCHGICTLLSPLDAALILRFAKNTQHDTSNAAPATQNDDRHVQSTASAKKTAAHLLKTSPKYCTGHTKRLSTRYETHLNVTKCHACHAKGSNATFQTSQSDLFCRTYHIGTAIRPSRGRLRTVGNGCRRLRTDAQRRANTPSTPRLPE